MKRIFLFIIMLFFIPLNVLAKSNTSTIAIDYKSGRIIYKENENAKKLIASITKVMTCIVVLENSDINKTITVGDEVLLSYGTNIYIEVGEIITIKDLLYGLMLRSGNDAAITLAVNTLGEEEFVKKMNEKAKEIGMNNTIFENPHGLDESSQNISTALDMALLARYAFGNKVYREIINTKKYIAQTNLKTYSWTNRVSILSTYKYCIGGKNGYTPKAGKTLISYAKKDDKIFIIVTLNDSDLYNHHKKLYDELFQKYDYYKIIDKNDFVVNSSLINNSLFLKNSFSYLLRKDEINKVSTLVEIKKNNDVESGLVRIYLNDSEIGKIKIYSKSNKKEDKRNIFQKIYDLFTR